MDSVKQGRGEGEPSSTLIGANVVVRGDIEGATDLHVQGRVLGKVAVTGLILDENAEIDGPVTAEAVVVGGDVNGSVTAKAVHVKSTGRIEGDINYASLQIEAGARVLGRLTLADAAELNANRRADAEPRSAKAPRAEPSDSGQDFVRMTARLRRANE